MAVFSNQDRGLLAQTPLFWGMSDADVLKALESVKCSVAAYRRGSILMVSGDNTNRSGLVMKGQVDIFTAPNLDGSQKVIARIGPGEMYGEPFNCLSYNMVPITVVAVQDLRVLELDIRTVFSADCDSRVKTQLLANLAVQFAEKIVVFRNKVEVLSQATLKMKVRTTIKQYAEYQNTFAPTIDFTKTGWAEYLSSNRNSIARVMKELQDEGSIKISGKRYELLCHDNVMFVQRSRHSPQNIVHAPVDAGSLSENSVAWKFDA